MLNLPHTTFELFYCFFSGLFVLIQILGIWLNSFPVFLGNRTAKSRDVGKVTLRYIKTTLAMATTKTKKSEPEATKALDSAKGP